MTEFGENRQRIADRQHRIAFEQSGFAAEAGRAVRDEQFRLAQITGIKQDISDLGLSGRVFARNMPAGRPAAGQRRPKRLPAPAGVYDRATIRQHADEALARLRCQIPAKRGRQSYSTYLQIQHSRFHSMERRSVLMGLERITALAPSY